MAFLVGKLTAELGGWKAIAERFPRLQKPVGKESIMQAGRFGQVHYQGTLVITRVAEGVDLQVLPPFCFGHKPIFLPWSEIRDARKERSGFQEFITFHVGTPSLGPISLPAKLFADRPFPPLNNNTPEIGAIRAWFLARYPDGEFTQWQVRDPWADDDGVWFLTRGGKRPGIQIESSWGVYPFVLETDFDEIRHTIHDLEACNP